MFIITKHNRLFWQSNSLEEQRLFKPLKKRLPFRSGHFVRGEHKTPLECLKIREFCRHQALASMVSQSESNALLPGWTCPFLEQNLPPPEKAPIKKKTEHKRELYNRCFCRISLSAESCLQQEQNTEISPCRMIISKNKRIYWPGQCRWPGWDWCRHPSQCLCEEPVGQGTNKSYGVQKLSVQYNV